MLPFFRGPGTRSPGSRLIPCVPYRVLRRFQSSFGCSFFEKSRPLSLWDGSCFVAVIKYTILLSFRTALFKLGVSKIKI